MRSISSDRPLEGIGLVESIGHRVYLFGGIFVPTVVPDQVGAFVVFTSTGGLIVSSGDSSSSFSSLGSSYSS